MMYLLETNITATIIDKIQFFIVFFGSMFGLLKAWQIYWKENSLGAAEIKKLEEKFDTLQESIDELKEGRLKSREWIRRLDDKFSLHENEFKDFIRKTLEYYQTREK